MSKTIWCMLFNSIGSTKKPPKCDRDVLSSSRESPPVRAYPLKRRFSLFTLLRKALALQAAPYSILAGRTQKKAARSDCFFGTPCGNRTHNCPLGGDCYIHLTKEAYSFGDRSSRELS